MSLHRRIAATYRTAVEADAAAEVADLYTDDAVLDAHVPNWRFQRQGRDAIAAQVCVLPRPGRFASFEEERSDRGLLVRFEWRQHPGAGGAVVRQLHTWQLAGERIAHHTIFCAGVWGPRLQQRMALEAPLVAP